MKILYLCMDGGIDVAGQSGGSIHIRAFVRALVDLGHEVTVVCSRASCQDCLLDVQVVVRPLTAWNHALAESIRAGNRLIGRATRNNPDAVRVIHNLAFYRTARSVAREIRPDLVYERYNLWGMAGIQIARNLSVPHVLEVNAPLTYEQQRYRAGLTCPPLARWVERVVWRRADLLVAVSEPLRRHLAMAGVKSDCIQVLPNAVDTRLFRPDLDGSEVRTHFNLGQRFVIGFAGSFKRWHGVEMLLAAFQDLRRLDPSMHLLLVGDGPLRPLLESQIRSANLDQWVSFAGGVPHRDVPQFLAAMDVAVAPYPPIEDFYYSPLKLFEYMAAGRAIVATRVGQVAEIVTDGLNGLLFEPGKQADLVECILRLRKSATLRKQLGRNASIACAAYTWKGNAARVIEWVGPLLRPRKPSTVDDRRDRPISASFS